jgi:hypothetical protein
MWHTPGTNVAHRQTCKQITIHTKWNVCENARCSIFKKRLSPIFRGLAYKKLFSFFSFCAITQKRWPFHVCTRLLFTFLPFMAPLLLILCHFTAFTCYLLLLLLACMPQHTYKERSEDMVGMGSCHSVFREWNVGPLGHMAITFTHSWASLPAWCLSWQMKKDSLRKTRSLFLSKLHLWDSPGWWFDTALYSLSLLETAHSMNSQSIYPFIYLIDLKKVSVRLSYLNYFDTAVFLLPVDFLFLLLKVFFKKICLSLYISTLRLSSDTPEEGVRYHYRWLWATICRELNSGPSEEQLVLLPIEPSHQPLKVFLIYRSFTF